MGKGTHFPEKKTTDLTSRGRKHGGVPGLVIKNMRRSDWPRVEESAYRQADMTLMGAPCTVSLLLLRRVTEPLTVTNGGERVTIVAPGYTWLQAARDGAPVWLTAMYDDGGRLLQMYFDITSGNEVTGIPVPRFRDMYLDLVLTPGGQVFELDADELEDAWRAGDITGDEKNRARAACDALHGWLDEHWAALTAACQQARETLLRGFPEA